jgi:hypothetical protein
MSELSMPFDILGLLLAMFGFVATQLVVGLAIACQWRARVMLFGLHIASGLLLFALGWHGMSEELGARMAVAALGETIATPLFLLAAPRMFDLRRISRANALGGLLIVFGISTWIGHPIFWFGQARTFVELHAPAGTWLGASLPVVGALVAGGAAWVAGSRLSRKQPVGRALAVYVGLAIGGSLLLHIVQIGWWFVDHGADVTPGMRLMITLSVVGLVVSLIRPLIVWFFAKREPEPAPVDAALPWVALWFVPHLAVRALLYDQMDAYAGPTLGFVIVALCLALAMVLTLAARDSLRDAAGAGPWLVAAALAGVLFALALYITHEGDTRYALNTQSELAPVVLLFATCVTAAWLRRRVTSEHERAGDDLSA